MDESIVLSLLLGVLLPLPLIIVLLRLSSYNPDSRRFHYFTTAAECRAIIDGTHFPGGKKNQLSPYQVRADVPENQAAKQAFGIRNSFTSPSETESKAFVAEVQGLTDRKIDWTGIRRACRRAACGAVHDVINKGTRGSISANGVRGYTLSLTEVIQAMTLHALFSILDLSFPGDDIETKHLITLGAMIHRITMDTERGMEYKIAFIDNRALHRALSDVFPGLKTDKLLLNRMSPLSLILPAFGPTWRLVRRMFLELHYRYHHADYQDQGWGSVLSEFAGQPEARVFHFQRQDEDRVSAEMLVKEALRLFTPTRHIQRVFQFEGEEGHVIGAADVEACHLDKKVWGHDATEFNPDRWRKASIMQELSFLPFGSRPSLCPAHARVGPMLVGLLVGSCWDMFKDMEMRSDDEEEVEGLKAGEGMRYYRGAYDGFYFDLFPGSGTSSVASESP
ncbi:hypothetical protein BDW69DRAFT_189066 [Aspergillus filifer]